MKRRYTLTLEEESEVGEDTARRGLGEAGEVLVASAIWNCCVPENLLNRYQQHLHKNPAKLGRGERKPEALRCMMDTDGVSAPHLAPPRPGPRGSPRGEQQTPTQATPPSARGAGHLDYQSGTAPQAHLWGRIDLQNSYWSIHLGCGVVAMRAATPTPFGGTCAGDPRGGRPRRESAFCQP